MKLRKELIVLSQSKYEKEEQFTMKNWHKKNQCALVRNEFRLEIRSYLTISRAGFQKAQHVTQKNNPFHARTWEIFEGSCMIILHPGKRFENEKQNQNQANNPNKPPKQTNKTTHAHTQNQTKSKNKSKHSKKQPMKQTNKTTKQENK